jgi:hypothetical protein
MSTKYSLIPLVSPEKSVNIHSITINGKVYFPAKNTAKMLGYSNGSRDIQKFVSPSNIVSYTSLHELILTKSVVTTDLVATTDIQEFNKECKKETNRE